MRGGGRSTLKPSRRSTAVHNLVVAVIGVVVMSAVMAPEAGSASASSGSGSARPAPLTASTAVTLAVRLIVGEGGGPVRAQVTEPGPITLRALVRGTRAPGRPSPDLQPTPVGTLWISAGGRPGVDRVWVDAYLNGVALAGVLDFQWRMTSAPTGSRAALTAPNTASPAIDLDRPGTYDLQVTVRDRRPGSPGGPASEQPVVLTAQPDDSPLGVPIETLSSKPGGHIRIDDQPVAGTSDPSGIYYAVLDRTSRAIVQSGTVTPDFNGVFSDLNTVIRNWSRTGTLSYLMVVSSASGGVDRSTINRLDVGPLRALGYIGLNAQQESALVKRPFSFLGLIGAAPGVAWGNINSIFGGSSNITGVLRVNVATGRYDLVDAHHPTIDTHAAGTTSDTSVIRVGDRTYTASMHGCGCSGGLHSLALNPDTLAPYPTQFNNRFLPTNGGGTGVPTDIANQRTLATTIGNLAAGDPRALLIIRTVGAVRPRESSLGMQIARLGGSSAVFNALNAAGGYAFIGRGVPTPADVTVESSSTAGQPGRLAGVLSRDRSWTYRLLASDPSGSLNTDLLTIADQPAQRFPAFGTPGRQAADDYIARQLSYCSGMPQTTCDLRRWYYLDSRANWSTKYTHLSTLQFPSGQQGFTEPEFNLVKSELLPEVRKVSEVFFYLNELKKPFQTGQLQSYVDLQAIAKAVEDAVRPPPADVTVSGLAYLNKILGYGKTVAGLVGPPQLKLFLDIVGAGIALAQELSTSSGAPAIGDLIRARTTELGSRLLAGYRTSEQSITGAGLLIVSDQGRLNAAADKINGDWRLPPDDTKASIGMRFAAQAWFHQTLLPLAYPNVYEISPPPPSGPTTPQSFLCLYLDRIKTYPLANLPDSAQTPQIVDFDNNGAAISRFALMAGRYVSNQYRYTTPPGSLTDPLFAPVNPNSTSPRPDLGLNKLAFYSGPTWPRRVVLHNNTRCP